jgi:hypothetical protein
MLFAVVTQLSEGLNLETLFTLEVRGPQFALPLYENQLKLNSEAFSPQANYTDRATAACWRS